jgi:hypothetical protein
MHYDQTTYIYRNKRIIISEVITMSEDKEFNGKRYKRIWIYQDKKNAFGSARILRKNKAWNARVIEEDGGFALYVRPTKPVSARKGR